MKKWIATLNDSGDRSGFIEYGLIVAILAMALVGVLSSDGDNETTLRQQQPVKKMEATRQHSSLLTGLGPLFEMTSGGHHD